MTIQETIYKGFPIVEVYKYLGVLIDNKMDIKYHITNISKKINVYTKKINY